MDKPKRPLSAYMIWLNSVREQIKSEHPGIKVTEIAKIGGEMWKSMDDKHEWVELAAKAKEQYLKDKETYAIALASYHANRGSGEGSYRRAQKRGKQATPAKKKRDYSEDEYEDDSDSYSESD